jgi:hypothetical protein
LGTAKSPSHCLIDLFAALADFVSHMLLFGTSAFGEVARPVVTGEAGTRVAGDANFEGAADGVASEFANGNN